MSERYFLKRKWHKVRCLELRKVLVKDVYVRNLLCASCPSRIDMHVMNCIDCCALVHAEDTLKAQEVGTLFREVFADATPPPVIHMYVPENVLRALEREYPVEEGQQ